MNNVDNVQGICNECKDERKKQTQEQIKKDGVLINDFVKVPLGKDDNKELIWFIVQSVDGDKVTGKLNNDPIFPQDIKCGDTMSFSVSDIEQLIRP